MQTASHSRSQGLRELKYISPSPEDFGGGCCIGRLKTPAQISISDDQKGGTMCEHCRDTIEENKAAVERYWSEIRDLLNYNRRVAGPVSQELKGHIEAVRAECEAEGIVKTDEEISSWVDGLRAEQIVIRCAAIASLSLGHNHGAPPSIVMGEWAGVMMKLEIDQTPLGRLLRLMGGEE